jgi:hypothetical protein
MGQEIRDFLGNVQKMRLHFKRAAPYQINIARLLGSLRRAQPAA